MELLDLTMARIENDTLAVVDMLQSVSAVDFSLLAQFALANVSVSESLQLIVQGLTTSDIHRPGWNGNTPV
jgi:hypothetical protein